ncbi:MAG: hypothetical protein BJ554DRAFT_144 [Olpidium bornovanus]|uniref:Ribosomal protein S13 n=1 Tax=Olpidium bornovanus TaxID=278681 RepID=A0A8H7ZUK9_9FUNG|nr:MAG: hypothetical protein BJ554DRAFT_144 [Olpidium bornovanus]
MSTTYLLGLRLSAERPVWKAISKFYGIGYVTGRQITDKLLIYPQARLPDLSEPELNRLATEISSRTIENALRKEILHRKIKEVRLGTNKGRALLAGMPVHGQRNKNQASTSRKFNNRGLEGMQIVAPGWPPSKVVRLVRKKYNN